uniref:Arrestin C-terminal-like domain-containing protein n=1 Tax=Oryzias sinensis TaxID=183150 RepID=A0A8C8A0V4_9TELE
MFIEIAYNSINERNTFTNGDFITGQVTVEMGKDSQIESLFVKFKAKAEVMWTETHGDHTVVYHSKDKYFTLKQYFIRNKNVKVAHTSPFVVNRGIPSSFKGSDGKIVFSLEAELSRSMRINKKSSTTINFVAKPDPNTLPELMTPVRNSKDKKMHVFTSGSVAMEVNLEKSGFFQGEGIKVVSSIQNNSSREVKPKYCLYRKHSFYAQGNKRYHTKDLVKEVGASIPKKTSETVKQVITIPHDAEPSILNCSIIKAVYRLKVSNDWIRSTTQICVSKNIF